MPANAKRSTYKVFIIVDSTALPHPSPAWLDENGNPITYATEREAQVEIAEWMIDKLNEFIAGERDFEDAIACTDFVIEVKAR